MCENRLTLKRDSWLLGVLNMAGKSLGKLYPTNYLATVLVVYLHKQVMKREHQKMKKNKKIKIEGKQYLIKHVAFTECSRVGFPLFSPMFTCGLFMLYLCFFKRRYLSNNY